MKPKFNTSGSRKQPFGVSLATVLFVCFSGSAQATVWEGDTNADWNENLNWSGDAGTVGSNAIINISTVTPPFPVISADIPVSPVDIIIGDGAGTSGRLDHTAGIVSTGNQNWMFVGRNGGTGVYNLADTAGSGGTFTGMGQGTGSLTVGAGGPGGRLYIGGQTGAGSTGTVNVHTTGILTARNQIQIGTNTSSGTLNIDSGTINAGTDGGDGDWFEIGNGVGSTGSLNMSGGTITKGGTEHFIVGANGGTGTMNLTGGTVTVNNEIWVANNPGSNGTLTISAGTITNNSWAAIGRSGAALGIVNMSGGTWNKTGGGNFIVGDNSPGQLNLSGGNIAINGETWVGQAGGGNGTLTLSGSGSISGNNWIAVGRDGGTGNVTMTGGTWTKSGGGAFIIGASGPGTLDQSAGLVDVQAGDTWMGENNTATYTLSGTGEFNANYFQVARGGASTGNVNLNGGTLRANQIVGGDGIENVSFNGTQIVARQDQANFIGGMDFEGATIDTGGLLIDSNGFTLTAPQGFDGTGGVVKSGAGTLNLSGANTFTGNKIVNGGSLVLGVPGSGNNTVNAGSLGLTAAGASTGSISLADGTTLAVTAPVAFGQLIVAGATLGTTGATTVNLGLGDLVGTNPTNSLLDVTGPLTVNGVVTINVAGARFTTGNLPLISFNAAQLTAPGDVVLGTLPAGVVATLVVDPNFFGAGLGAVYLNISSVALPEWDGTNEVLVTKFGDTTTGSADIVVTNATGIVVGQQVRGEGIPVGATVSGISGTTITLSQVATATALGVDIDFVVTAGTDEGIWNTTTLNWVDQVTTTDSVYANPNPVLFSDNATGPTDVVLNITVNPSEVVFNNSILPYSLSGTGKISGTASLSKSGTANLALNNTNDYTGVTTFAGGTTTVATLTNGGVAGPLGAATAASSNLVISGGALNYTGAAFTWDRGFTLAGPGGGMTNANDLTISGQVLSIPASGANFRKRGAGNLTFTLGGANTFGAGGQALYVDAGTITFDGTAGGQINTVNGEMWVGDVLDTPANLNVTNTSLNVSSWLAVGPGNGNDGVTNVNISNSTVQTGGFSTGYNNGQAANASEAFVTVTGSTWTNVGLIHIAESADSTATVNVVNTQWTTNSGATDMSAGPNTTSTLTISGTSEMKVDRFLMALGDGSKANVIIEDSGSLNKTTGSWMSIGNSGTGEGTITVRENGTLINTAGDFNISDVGSSKGTLNVEDSATVTNGGAMFVGKNSTTQGTINQSGGTFTAPNTYIANQADSIGTINTTGGTMTLGGNNEIQIGARGTGVWNQSAGVVNASGWTVVGRYNVAGASGQLNVSGGTFNQVQLDRGLIIGEETTGTLTVSGTGVVNAAWNTGILVANGATGIGTINLNTGGTISTKGVREGAGGTSTFNFNGGTLIAATGVNADFMSGLDSAVILAGGALIDTNGQTVTIAQVLNDDGGDRNLTKLGAGTLLLNGANSYFGTTTVAAGTLGGSGSIAGPLVVPSGSSIAPGTAAGTFTAGDSATIGGTYVCEIDGAAGDRLAVSGALTISPGAVLDFNELSAPTAPVYVIASYGSLSGTFTVQDLPAGYSLDYAYNNGLNTKNIALVQDSTPFSSWMATYFPGETDLAIIGSTADPDGDGQSNAVEFALGGVPNDGSNNAKVYSLMADSDADVDATSELLMTIAVRSGTPAFAGSPSPTAAHDGVTYTIQGSTALDSFTTNVLPVAPVTTGLPAAPAGYEYRTFSLDGSNGTPAKGFLRVQVGL
jgi:autotransporter-associated beta strand protein